MRKEEMEFNSSLEKYRQFKINNGIIEQVYDNSSESTLLLASARAGFSDTNSFSARFEGGDGRWVLCEHHTET